MTDSNKHGLGGHSPFTTTSINYCPDTTNINEKIEG